MSGRFEIINPLTHPDWDDMVRAADGCSFFHTSSWARVLHESYGYKPNYLVRLDNGRLTVLVPVMEIRSMLTGARGVSLPFTDICEPILPNGPLAEEAVSCLKEFGRCARWKYIEFRGQRLFPEGTPCHASYYHHTLPLSMDEKSILSGFKKGVGRIIRKAAASGIEVISGTTLPAIREFYRLHCLTRKRHGFPPQPFSFFRKIHEHVLSNGHGFVSLAQYQGENIAGAVFFHFGDQATYKYSASDRRYNFLNPTNLILWNAIRWYAKEGFTGISLGRTDLSAEGLRHFKRTWGGSEEIIKYYHYDLKQGSFAGESAELSEIGRAVCRKLPIPILKMAGALLYRHFG